MWDRTGIVASVVCMIHCLAAPVVVTLLPAVRVAWLEHPLIHQVLAIAVILAVAASIVPAFLHHRRWPVIAVAAVGLGAVCWAAFVCGPCGCWSGETPIAGGWLVTSNTGLSLVGGLLLVVAHVANIRASHCCRIG
jgi:hypothetical protein